LHPPALQTTEILPGLWRIRLPFHLELNHVNVYLVRLAGDGWMMIDTGFGNNDSWDALEQGLTGAGVAWGGIRELFITHTHPDHWGLAPRILSASGAKLSMHAIEAANLRRLAESVHKPSVLDKRLRSWGTPEDQILRITGAFLDIRQRFEAITADRVFEGGESIETEALGPLTTVFTPGHSPGHLCLYSEHARVLVSGDHVLPKITPHISWAAEADSLADYRRSLDAVAGLPVETVVSGHGEPFGDLAERVAEIKRHHDARCNKIRAALDSGATTPHEIVTVLWPKALSPFNYRFAIYEVMAHLKFMGLDASPAVV
jgi:glyoxylase-like metal-dependent hydrolase (beta-lactamase superfamily II)